ncbi:N-acetylmuramoyl-L-alanine amidase [Tissierella sp.]|uniref:N-acetylmuramoyl-L-alanine amidase family protein n=1 Tax=Tissierella sp. TaxID=41274 RepID=UPI0028626893|nr:N-acetylmuramoyl-L-alanine amidase [Tissierella sp.]MDR7855041.1 N-acetylmuramoyl-L-alanine amidase [Tissierella sp.]
MIFRRIRAAFLFVIIVFLLLQVFNGTFFIGGIFGRNKVIVIDPGHGGIDSGAVSINERYEKDINLDISKKLYERLRLIGYKVILTRDTDEYVDNKERANLANKKAARIFLSIHCNSLENSNSTNGIQVLYYPYRESNIDDPQNEILAQNVLEKMLLNTGVDNKGIVAREDLLVLNQTNMPAIIVECGFLSNTNEANLLLTDEYQDKIVDGIVDGLDKYFNY